MLSGAFYSCLIPIRFHSFKKSKIAFYRLFDTKCFLRIGIELLIALHDHHAEDLLFGLSGLLYNLTWNVL